MRELLTSWGAALMALTTGTLAGAVVVSRNGWRVGVRREEKAPPRTLIANLIRDHFRPVPTDNITISERSFPYRVRADLQRAIDRLFGTTTKIRHFCGVRQDYSHRPLNLATCVVPSDHNAPVAAPPQYEEINVGDEEPLRCLKNGIWFLEEGLNRFVVLFAAVERYGEKRASSSKSAPSTMPTAPASRRSSSATWRIRSSRLNRTAARSFRWNRSTRIRASRPAFACTSFGRSSASR